MRFFLWCLVGVISFFPTTLLAQDQTDVHWYQQITADITPSGFEQSLSKFEGELAAAVDSRDLAREAIAAKSLGFVHVSNSHDLEKALDYFIRALVIEDSLNLTTSRQITYMGIASVFEKAGNYQKAEEELSQALELNRGSNDPLTSVVIMNAIGRVSALLGKVDVAEENYQAVLQYAESLEDASPIADAYFNLAKLTSKKGDNIKALEQHKKALAIRRSIGDKKNESVSLHEIANLYRLMNNTEKALANYVVSLELKEALKDKKGIAQSYNEVGALYFNQKNFTRAIANLNLALEAGRESQSQEEVLRSFDLLSQCYKQTGDFQKALAFRDEYMLVNDFLEHDRNERALLESQNRYLLEKKEEQIARLEEIRKQRELEIANQRKYRNFLLALIGLSSLVAVLVFVLYWQKRRSNRSLKAANDLVKLQNTQLVELNATKDKFFSIISHDLKGPLNSLTSFSGLLINHTDSLSKDEIQMLAKDLDKSLKNLFALLENLLEWSRSQTGNIEFKPAAFDLNSLLQQNRELLQVQAQNKKINIVFDHAGPLMVQAHKNSINTVIRNLVANAIKFTPEGGQITLRTAKTEDRKIRVSITDTGVGMSPELQAKLFRIDTKITMKGTADEKGTGLGLILCKDFVEKNGGTIWVESVEKKGSTFNFTVLPAVVSQPSAVVHS